MINSISSWAKSIVLAVIIATILEMILPEGKNKKYIKTVIGIYILFTIISPILSKVNGGNIEIDTSKYENYFSIQNYTTASTNIVDINLDSAYVSNIKSDIKQRLKEKGYEVKNINIDVELKDEERYGIIKSLSISVIKVKENNTINTIQKVEIKISNEQNNSSEGMLGESEKKEIKKILQETYSINAENINIE